MSEYLDRYNTIAGGFTARVSGVSGDAWENPSPCAGWVARDIVGHVVGWVPSFFSGAAGLVFEAGPAINDDPMGAWLQVDATLRSSLTDPHVAGRAFDGPPGRMTVEQSIDMIVSGDLLIHTWDLARAAGLDERLDPTQVHRMFEGVQPYDEMLRSSGQYGPRVVVPDDADEQTKLLAFMGRNPLQLGLRASD